MEQIDLFDGYASEPTHAVALLIQPSLGSRNDRDCESSPLEEIEVYSQGTAIVQPPLPISVLGSVGAAPALPPRLLPWPVALNWSDALTYTSFSARSLRRAERTGLLTFKRVGPNGGKIVLRTQLDQLVERTFDVKSGSIEEDFDFG